MIGAIIGDIAGSKYEYLEFKDSMNKIINVERRKEILSNNELLTEECFISDDTILTVAIMDAIINKKEYGEMLRTYGKQFKYSNRENFFKYMFSPNFVKWANSTEIGTSIGNGSAMRVSPIGYLYNDLQTVQKEAAKSAKPSHNSEEAINGAEAIASTIYLIRDNKTKEEIKEYITDKYKYSLDMDLDMLRQTYTFNGDAKTTVPQAISIFLQSNGFEDSIRKAISIGGDTDTIACMVGGISEAYYGVPKELREKALTYLPKEFKKTILQGYRLYEKTRRNINFEQKHCQIVEKSI